MENFIPWIKEGSYYIEWFHLKTTKLLEDSFVELLLKSNDTSLLLSTSPLQEMEQQSDTGNYLSKRHLGSQGYTKGKIIKLNKSNKNLLNE